MCQKKTFCFFVIFTLFISLFSSCDILDTNTPETTIVTSKDGITQLSISNGWRESRALYEVNFAVTLAVEGADQQNIMVITESKADFAKSINADGYCKIVKETMKTIVDKASTTEDSEVALDNYNALQFALEGEIDSMKLSYIVNIVETPGFFHQIIGFSAQSKMSTNKDKLMSIIKTFGEVEQSTEPNKEVEGSKDKVSDELVEKKVTSNSELFTLVLPDNWVATDKGSDSYDPTQEFSAFDAKANAYVVIYYDNKIDLVDSYSLEEYSESIIDFIDVEMGVVEVLEYDPIAISSYDSKQWEFVYQDGTSLYSQSRIVLETEKYFFEIILNTNKSKYDEYRADYIEMLDSFEIID